MASSEATAADPMPLVVALALGFVMIVSGLLVAWIAVRAANGRLGRNHLAGMRMQSTMSSDDAWLAGHQAARSATLAAAGASILSGVIVLFRPSNALGMTTILVGCGLLVALVGVGAFRANRAAAQVDQPSAN